jgi:hypothetical protein
MAARVCRNATIAINGAALNGIVDGTVTLTNELIETSELTSEVRTYVSGIRSGTASMTVFYDQNDATFAALETAYNGGTSVTLLFTFHGSPTASYSATAFITSLSPSIAMMDIIKCSVQFQLSGVVAIG